MIKQDNRMLLDEDVNFEYDVNAKFKGFAVKYRYGTKRGTLDYSSMLAYACAKNDCGLVSRMLESEREFEAHASYGFRWEKAWKRTWAKALWHADYNGRGPIVRQLVEACGWLQPPLGYHPYYQFTEPVPDAPDAPLSYMFVQGHTTIRVFAISNAVSFFFAIVAGTETTCFIGELEQMYVSETVENLRFKLKRTRTLFILSCFFVLIAFSSAAIAVLPPIKGYQKDMYITIALGGFVCMAMLFFFTLSRRRVFYEAKSYLGCMFTKLFKT